MTESFRVEGMTCAHCVKAVTRALTRLAPGVDIAVDLATGWVQVAGPIARDAAIAAIAAEGYRVEDGTARTLQEGQSR